MLTFDVMLWISGDLLWLIFDGESTLVSLVFIIFSLVGDWLLLFY